MDIDNYRREYKETLGFKNPEDKFKALISHIAELDAYTSNLEAMIEALTLRIERLEQRGDHWALWHE